jgi:hypothetical protein
MLLPIVFVAIAPYQVHVIHKMLQRFVHVVAEFLLYRSEVHRLLYYVEVIHNVEFDWVNWFKEPESAFLFH